MQPRSELRKVVLGLLMLLGMHIIFATVLATVIYIIGSFAGTSPAVYLTVIRINTALFYSFLWIGVTQLLYVIPTLIVLRRKRKWELFKGVVIGAVITAFLCGGCWLAIGSLTNS